MESIHPSAQIHPTVILEGNIQIGAQTIIGAYAYLKGPLIIGENNHIGSHTILGADPEHKTKPAQGCVLIGNGNVIREFSVVQRGTGELETQIQDHCYIMAYTYIAHDCLIESEVILCARVSLAGHCHILKGAILGLGAATHQFSTIGSHAFVGMGSVVVKDIPPFCTAIGNPASFLQLNLPALEKLSINPHQVEIENSNLKSHHPYIQECLNSFKKHSRRKTIPMGISGNRVLS